MHKSDASQPTGKETRIRVCIKPAQKTLIAHAARLRHTTLTEFVLDNALQAAKKITYLAWTPSATRPRANQLAALPHRRKDFY